MISHTSPLFRFITSELSTFKARLSSTTRLLSFCNSTINTYTERTHTCGQLSKDDIGKQVILYGWVQYSRFNNKIIALRDSYGVTQCIVGPKQLTKSFRKVSLHNESVIKVIGQVRDRPVGEKNDRLSTGDVEVLVDQLLVLGAAKGDLPILTRDDTNSSSISSINRLKYRYLDLRSGTMQKALRFKSKAMHILRNKLVGLKFVECETPTLNNRTPGGANEFIVPTQEAGKFYSLAQSPQQLKQLLMIGGLDRYFQICRCYRDESGRSDRQPEFTQVDIELSFTNQGLVMNLIEEVVYDLLTKISANTDITESYISSFSKDKTLRRLSFSDAFSRYGTDKPDTRYDWLIEPHEHVGLRIDIPYHIDQDKLRETQSSLDILPESSPISVSFMNSPGHTRLITSDRSDEARKFLGAMRTSLAAELAKEGNNIYRSKFEFLWIIDFPLFTKKEQGKLEPNHHPFTAPSQDSLHLLQNNPSAVIGQHYDLVLNGQEVAGGSIRINDAELQNYIFREVLQVNDDSFKYFVEALRCGCPPHGGIAIGLDRLVAILMQKITIKDVIAFPKTNSGRDLMTESPHEISADVKNLYHIS